MEHSECRELKSVRKAPQAAIGQVLIEALPYIRQFEGTTFVIKYGGSAMKDAFLKNIFAQNVTLLRKVGINVVLVHGGGDAITRTAEKLGLNSRFVQGRRVTDKEMISVIQMTLAGKVNQDIVQLISEHGGKAVGVTGLDADTISAVPHQNAETLGLVGEVAQINTSYIDLLCHAGLIPVIAPIGFDEKGNIYNINADAADFIEQGIISGGMIPKVLSAFNTLDGGVGKIHLIDGKSTHSLLLEIFTHEGVGTQFIAEQD